MSQNAYQTPQTNVEMPDTYQGSPLRGIAAGVLISFIGTLFVGIAVGIMFAIYFSMQGYNEKQMELELTRGDLILSIYLIGASLFTILGAYISSRIINYSLYRHGIILAFVILILGEVITLLLPTTEPGPLWFSLMEYAVLLPCVLLGCYIWDKNRKTG